LPKSTRDDAHGISTGIAIIGRVKRLLKIPDRMQPEPRHPRGQRISFRMGINPGKFVRIIAKSSRAGRSRLWEVVAARFVADSPMEGDGFEPSVPLVNASAPCC
jgi:hypothetical protein